MDRIQDVNAFIFDTGNEDLVGKVQTQTIRATLDMETVAFVRDDPDDPERCVVETTADALTLAMTRAEFAALWRSYRKTRDPLANIRN